MEDCPTPAVEDIELGDCGINSEALDRVGEARQVALGELRGDRPGDMLCGRLGARIELRFQSRGHRRVCK